MIAIITEKPSVGQEIARVVRATEKCNGYMQGNGYLVTWALGHLVQLALPEFYGFRRGTTELPLIPDPFQLTIRQRRGEGKYVTDGSATRQLNIIAKVLEQSTQVIAATDAGREGELIFRWICEHLGCRLPVKRLWISSLTDEAIVKGLSSLREGADYDNLYRAADCRAKADWLVGINASAALSEATRSGNHSLGRVQTPTLALVCSRYLENRRFAPSDYWQLYVSLRKGEGYRKFRYVEDLRDKAAADAMHKRVMACPEATVGKVERKTVQEQPPLLYDLTALQRDCNVRYGMSAEGTLNAAQSLYEKKLISYPRTGSRHITPDILPGIPSLLRMALRMERFAHLADGYDTLKIHRRPVDAAKVTDHHALLFTGDYAGELSTEEKNVYHLIAGRMLEAFAPRCEKESLTVEADVDGLLFRSRTVTVTDAGWRGVWNEPEEPEDAATDEATATGEFIEGETLPLDGGSLATRKTQPRPLLTEASLLGAMEMPCQRGQSERSSAMSSAAGIRRSQLAGKDIVDQQAREAMRDCGIGTPATRASIIETLFRREYIERSGKSLVPTERGLYVYQAVKDMRIADAELTGSWEKSLAAIEKGAMSPDTFMESIVIYTRQITREVQSLRIPRQSPELPLCPKCRTGGVAIRHKLAKCDNPECGLVVFRRFLNKELSDDNIRQLLSKRKTRLIEGFEGKRGKPFDARLKFDKNYNLVFDFPDDKKKPAKKATAKSGSGSAKKKTENIV